MSYTAELVDKRLEDGKIRVFVAFDNTKDRSEQTFLLNDPGELVGILRNYIELLEKRDSFMKSQNSGNIDLTSPVIVLTPDETKRKQYGEKLTDLKKKKQLVDLGILISSDLLVLQAEVKQLATELGEI